MKGRTLKPIELAYADGAFVMNPERLKNRTDPDMNPEIGDAPMEFDVFERAAFQRIVTRIWWVRASDYELVVLAAQIIARNTMGLADVQERNLLKSIMIALGGSPTSRNNVQIPKDRDRKNRFT